MRVALGMPSYTRSSRAGGTRFFTVRLADHRSDLLVLEVETLRHVTRQTRDRLPFDIDEIVVMPNAIHTIWTLPKGELDFSARWRMLKSLFSRQVRASGTARSDDLPVSGNAVWQRRFWEHPIRDKDDFTNHRHMIHTAPVQAGLVKCATDWPYSSIHRAVARGEGAGKMSLEDAHQALLAMPRPSAMAPRAYGHATRAAGGVARQTGRLDALT